ncbi:MAG: class II aldolase/adducin family protein [Chloroflexi bacterium]|nr:class II aldolase/adducin family protein [Chloroflexota bacterium]
MWDSEKKTVLQAARLLAEKGLVVGTSGNVSLRFRETSGRELVVITPTGRYYNTLGLDDLVVVDLDGERIDGRHAPSEEKLLHIGIYKARQKLNAVIHSHPVFSSAVAAAGLDIPPFLDDQVVYLGGEIKVAAYALPGSLELAKNAISALGPRNAVLLANHGALSVGKDMQEAFAICELMEKTARTYIFALSLGRVNPLPAEAIEMETAFFQSHHGDAEGKQTPG